MTRIADYQYKIHANYLFVKDLDLGNVSLTNSLETVLKEIQKKENIKELDIIQIDSEEELNRVFWDEKYDQVAWQYIHPEEQKILRAMINQLF